MERRKMRLGNANLAFIAARRERSELCERGACLIALSELFRNDPKIELRTRIAGIRGRSLPQNEGGRVELARIGEGFAEVEQQRGVIGIGVHGVAARRDGL